MGQVFNSKESFKSVDARFNPAKNVSTIPIDSLRNLAEAGQDRAFESIEEIESNYDTYSRTRDELLAIDTDNGAQRQEVDSLKTKYGLTDEFFDFDLNNMLNSSKVTHLDDSTDRLMADRKFKRILKEQALADQFLEGVSLIETSNPALAAKARGDFMQQYVNKESRNANEFGFPLDIGAYATIDVDAQFRAKLDEKFQSEPFIETKIDDSGQLIIVNTRTGKQITDEDYVQIMDEVVGDLSVNQAFKNNWDAYVATNSERGGFTDDEAKAKIYSDWKLRYVDPKTVDVAVRDNKARTAAAGGGADGLTADQKNANSALQALRALNEGYHVPDSFAFLAPIILSGKASINTPIDDGNKRSITYNDVASGNTNTIVIYKDGSPEALNQQAASQGNSGQTALAPTIQGGIQEVPGTVLTPENTSDIDGNPLGGKKTVTPTTFAELDIESQLELVDADSVSTNNPLLVDIGDFDNLGAETLLGVDEDGFPVVSLEQQANLPEQEEELEEEVVEESPIDELSDVEQFIESNDLKGDILQSGEVITEVNMENGVVRIDTLNPETQATDTRELDVNTNRGREAFETLTKNLENTDDFIPEEREVSVDEFFQNFSEDDLIGKVYDNKTIENVNIDGQGRIVLQFEDDSSSLFRPEDKGSISTLTDIGNSEANNGPEKPASKSEKTAVKPEKAPAEQSFDQLIDGVPKYKTKDYSPPDVKDEDHLQYITNGYQDYEANPSMAIRHNNPGNISDTNRGNPVAISGVVDDGIGRKSPIFATPREGLEAVLEKWTRAKDGKSDVYELDKNLHEWISSGSTGADAKMTFLQSLKTIAPDQFKKHIDAEIKGNAKREKWDELAKSIDMEEFFNNFTSKQFTEAWVMKEDADMYRYLKSDGHIKEVLR